MNPSPASIREDYLSGSPSLLPFYNYPIQQPDFDRIIADKSKENIDRKLLQRVIREQYGDLPLSDLSRRHLEWLGEANSFTLTTGHQLVLYGGPLFTTYKVLSAAKLARQLNEKYPHQRFVPIFWIHTEDHDFEEVNHYYGHFGQKNQYSGKFSSQVGNHVIEDSVSEVVPHPSWAHFYEPGRKWSQAYRALAYELFDSYGVLILDADHPELKAVFRSVMQAEIKHSVAYHAITRQSADLHAAHYQQQINPREINLFYLDAKGRDRIDQEGDDFVILGRQQKMGKEAMLQLIQDHPERFSPNVSLRPLYQEMILPNLAYFGGWGEISYWLQLKGLFEKVGVNFPLLLPRFSATIFTQAQSEAWQALGFTHAEILLPIHELYRRYLPNIWDETEFLQKHQELLAQVDALTRYIKAEISPTLARSSMALRAKIQRRLNRLQKKAGKVMRNRYPKKFQEIEQLKLSIQPDGKVQERTLSLFSFDNLTPQHILEQVWQGLDPLKYEHNYLVIDAL